MEGDFAIELVFLLNGRRVELACAPDTRVIDILREHLGLTGTKEGCGTGECGACSIHVDGELKLACLMVAAQLEGRTVTTIEGLAPQGELHPLQQAFIDSGAVQCGFCTPGMVMAGAALLAECPAPSDEQIQIGMSGNLCRCTGYQKIVQGVRMAASAAGEKKP